jgi:hypothetical protein
MWNKPSTEELAKLPPFYSTERVPIKEKVLHMHFFIGGCDWYAAEYDETESMFFGFACLNGDLEMAEWGYFSLDELSELKVKWLEVDRDLHFPPTKAKDVELIREAQRWEKEETHEHKAHA